MSGTGTVISPIDVAIGARIQELRKRAKPRPLTIVPFSELMRERVGRGWHPAAVIQTERGQRPLRAVDLIAVAQVLNCTIADILDIPEPVDLGGDDPATAVVQRLDSLIGGDGATPEAAGWARFEQALDALNDMRNQSERYKYAIEVVRRYLARNDSASAVLRTRIEDSLRDAEEIVVAEIAEIYSPEPSGSEASSVDLRELLPAASVHHPSPTIVAARDALGTTPLPPHLWQQR